MCLSGEDVQDTRVRIAKDMHGQTTNSTMAKILKLEGRLEKLERRVYLSLEQFQSGLSLLSDLARASH